MTRRRGIVTRRHICDRVKPEEETGRAAEPEKAGLKGPGAEAPELEVPELLRAAGKPDWAN